MNTSEKKEEKKKFRGWKPAMRAKDGHADCLCCPGPTDKASMRTRIYGGFGGWAIFKNKKLIYMGDHNREYNESPTLLKFELMARKEPNANWTAVLDLPLRGAKYQRHDKNTWVLIETNLGFA